MRQDSEARLEAAIQAVNADEPEESELSAATQRVANRLGILTISDPPVDAIASCADVQRLLPAYHADSVPRARALVIEAHLRECTACRRQSQRGAAPTDVDWSAPRLVPPITFRPRTLAWGLAAGIAVLMTSAFLYRAYWQVPPGVRAEVISVEGPAYRVTGSGEQLVSSGSSLNDGDELRTGSDGHAVLRLSDGSSVEVNQRSEFDVTARGRNMTVALDSGAVIVQAAKRSSGHLYVKTPDCRVAVTGTIFSVNSGIKGSRVAVVEGTVHVMHAGVETVMNTGDQVATSESLSPVPVEDQISWSHDRGKYLVLLGQFAALRNRLERIPFPSPRYASDLLQRVPANTLFYVSIPNLGEFLSQANAIFHDQLQKSPTLQQWWSHGQERNGPDLDALVDKLHQMSQYLGDEVVVVGMNSPAAPEVAVVADVKQSGIADFLKKQIASMDPSGSLVIVSPSDLPSLGPASGRHSQELVLVREHEVVFSNSAEALKQINTQLNAGSSGFATSEFGQQIAAAYGRGAGVILAADLRQMAGNTLVHMHGPHANAVLAEDSGMADMRYLIAEHRETNGQPDNHLNLQFAGARHGVASWLAGPAPIGSLDFVTPNAAFAAAFLSKDPKTIVDDILTMAALKHEDAPKELTEAEEKLGVNLREDLAANFGGDALLSLDGPILPTPSWKLVIEVHDSERLEKTLEQLAQAIRNQPDAKGHGVTIEWKDIGSQRYYTVRDLTSGSEVAHYTFDDGYMIVGPSRAILMEAMHAHASGDSLARSAAFKAILPKDQNENYSAIAYQNLGPVLAPLMSQLKGDAAAAVQELAADARPTAVCAWGEESRIEVASNSRLFGFDFLTLGSLLNDGNKHGMPNVSDSHGRH